MRVKRKSHKIKLKNVQKKNVILIANNKHLNVYSIYLIKPKREVFAFFINPSIQGKAR